MIDKENNKVMDPKIQELLDKLTESKEKWEKEIPNYYDWAITHKAHAQGVVCGLKEAIWYINKMFKEEE